MKRHSINFNWPAKLFGFSSNESTEKFSRGKLSVFYKGETEDHRYFSNEFSEEVIKSLPYVPVVGYYDEKKDDFVGHATQQQIYGIVDPCREPTFEVMDDGKTWAICDVVLYTERPDQVGEIAKKIEGHNQSLELGDMKYVINYDERKHLKNIEITAGQIIGVSVLGTSERPAFTGSQFFSYNPDFEQKMRLLKEFCEQESLGQDNGGSEMNLQEFMKLSWGEISTKVSKAVEQEYVNEYYTYVVDMYKEYAIVRFLSLIDGSNKLMKVNYSLQKDGSISLGDVKEVYVSYNDYALPTEKEEDEEKEKEAKTEEEDFAKTSDDSSEKEDEDDKEDAAEEDSKDDEEDSKDAFEMPCEDSDKDEEDEDKEDDKEAEEFECNDEGVSEAVSDNETIADAVDTANCVSESEVDAAPEEYAKAPTDDEVKEDKDEDEDEDKSEDSSSSTSFTQSERAELENLKKEKKINLLDSYKEILSEEEYNSFKSDIDNFSEEGLELELLRKFKSASGKAKKTNRMYAFNPTIKTNAPVDSLEATVSKYLRG